MILSPNFISYTHLNQLILRHESIEIKQRSNLPIFKFKCQLTFNFFCVIITALFRIFMCLASF